MAVLSKIADCLSWNFLAVLVALSVMVGGVLIRLNQKRLSSLTKNSVEQMRQISGLQLRQVDFGLEKHHDSSMEDGQAGEVQTIPINNVSSVTRSATSHRQFLNSPGTDHGQRDKLSTAPSPRSPQASKVRSETSLSSLVAELDSTSEPPGTITSVTDDPMLLKIPKLNELPNKHEHVRNVEDGRDKEKHDMKQQQQKERNDEHKIPQLGKRERGKDKSSGFPAVDAPRLGKPEVVDCYAAHDYLRGIGSQHQLPHGLDTQTREVLEEFDSGNDHGKCEGRTLPHVCEIPSEVAMWRLAANRCADQSDDST